MSPAERAGAEPGANHAEEVEGPASPARLDLGFGLVFAVGGAALFVASRSFAVMIPGTPIGPGLMPAICGLVFMLCGAGLAIGAIRRLRAGEIFVDSEDNAAGSLGFALLVVGGLALVVAATPYLGFIVTAALYSFAVTMAGGARGWGAALSAVLVTLGVYALFSGFMRVPLPAGLLF